MTKDDKPNRRDVLNVVTGIVAVAGAGLAAWPFVASMNPDALRIPLESDQIALNLKAGGLKIIKFRNQPYILARLTPEEIAMAESRSSEKIRDKNARNANLNSHEIATLPNRLIAGTADYLLFGAVCTRQECVVAGDRNDNVAGGRWGCPCCGSEYDEVGRVIYGPAPKNLLIPAFRMEQGPSLVLI